MIQGVIKLGEQRAESKCTLVYGQMNEPPGARARVALTGTACRNHDGQPEVFFCFHSTTLTSTTAAVHSNTRQHQAPAHYVDGVGLMSLVMGCRVLGTTLEASITSIVAWHTSHCSCRQGVEAWLGHSSYDCRSNRLCLVVHKQVLPPLPW